MFINFLAECNQIIINQCYDKLPRRILILCSGFFMISLLIIVFTLLGVSIECQKNVSNKEINVNFMSFGTFNSCKIINTKDFNNWPQNNLECGFIQGFIVKLYSSNQKPKFDEFESSMYITSRVFNDDICVLSLELALLKNIINNNDDFTTIKDKKIYIESQNIYPHTFNMQWHGVIGNTICRLPTQLTLNTQIQYNNIPNIEYFTLDFDFEVVNNDAIYHNTLFILCGLFSIIWICCCCSLFFCLKFYSKNDNSKTLFTTICKLNMLKIQSKIDTANEKKKELFDKECGNCEIVIAQT